MIDILVPVLGRPHNARPLVENIRENTVVPYIIVFLATRGDDEQIEACKRTGSIVHLVPPGFGEYARKINAGVAAAYGDPEFFFLGADDIRFHRGWDEKAINAWKASGRPVIGTNDLGNATVMSGKHSTHSLVHRSYVALGTVDDTTKLLHDGYDHNYVDTEFIQTAQARNAFIFAADSLVEHLHPFWQKGSDDVIYKKGRARYRTDGRLFQSRTRLWRRERTR